MSSETDFGVSQQPVPTCPQIDKIIKILNDVERSMRRYEKLEDREELIKVLDSIQSDLFPFRSSVEDQLESIRKHVESIRAWGEEWKQVAIEL